MSCIIKIYAQVAGERLELQSAGIESRYQRGYKLRLGQIID